MAINNRILIVDDNEGIRKDYRKILCPQRSLDLTAAESILFDEEDEQEWDLSDFEDTVVEEDAEPPYDLDFASQAEEAFEMVKKAEEENCPYAFLFTDVLMPPGKDGVWLTKRIWESYPDTEVVLVTAHADYSWEDIVTELGETSRLVIIKKPFDRITIKQITITLSEKKAAEMELKQHRDHLADEVARRTHDLVDANQELELASNAHRRKKELLESINRHIATLFERNEVSVWYEDFSKARIILDDLRKAGVEDLAAYLRSNRSFLTQLADSVKVRDADQETLRMFRSDVSSDFLSKMGKLFTEQKQETFIGELLAIWNGDKTYKAETEQVGPKGSKMYLSLSMTVPQTEKEFKLVPVSVRDITKQRKAEEILKYQAYYDDLTKLANKKLFQERLEMAVEELRRKQFGGRMSDPENEEDDLVGVMFIDLDGFKAVNDNLGHAAGDQLLQQVAQRLKACCKRRSDTVARLGGDEFAVILPKIGKPYHAEVVGRRVLEVLNKSFDLQLSSRNQTETVKASISGSIGVSIFPLDAKDSHEVVEKADTAMYKAKRAGKNALRFFTQEMEGEAERRRVLEKSLEQALEQKELRLFYQPIVDLKTGKIKAVEALLRWEHPKEGLVEPSEFLAIAEDTGLISEIDRWVVNTACSKVKDWCEIGLSHLSLFMNLSDRFCRELKFKEYMEEARQMAPSDCPPPILEIKESIFVKGGKQVRKDLAAVKEMGFRLALDDFGTGSSSLTELFSVPLDFLKIDNSVVANLDHPLTGAVIAVAHKLGLEVIGEGAETGEQVQYLRNRNCDTAQGFFFSKPLTDDAFMALAGSHGYLDLLSF